MRSWLRNPLTWILVAAAGLRLSGLFWGLPASDGWDDDGFVPRNFLTALALTYKPDSYFTYPPLHALLLAVLTLPGVIAALLQASSFQQADVIGEFTKPGYMTFFMVIGRLVNLLMSLGIIWCAGQMARLLAGARAGLLAAAACALNFGLIYYGQVGNLDVPYLFWSLLGLLWVMRAVIEQQPRYFWWASLCAAAAVATKDQAYALFLLSLPVFLLVWFAAQSWPREHWRGVVTRLIPAALVALGLLLLVDGAITNPGGFARRLAFLTGPASQDYAEYVQGPSGWLALTRDMMAAFSKGYGLVAVTLAMLGLAAHLARSHGGLRVAGLLPVLAMLSFTVCFNFAALRSDARFLLPQAVLACVYIGVAADILVFAAQPWMRLLARGALTVTALFALHQAVAINAAFLLDPRYDAESWMASHMRPGDSIETYGQNAYLPRFPRRARVSRIGGRPVKLRNPLPGVWERQEAFDAIGRRKPRFIVVSDWWAQHYRIVPETLPPGRVYSRNQQLQFADGSARRYFAALYDGRLGYRLAHTAAPASRFWAPVHIHESLNETIHIFERAP
ncbi:MAG TPA: hypothetical protein VJL82_10540 [Rhizomicrobium sp.]|nr:hypothetical protein [Rhizomicrobium sp.]